MYANLVPRPSAEELEAVQNNELFEGDILGIAGNGIADADEPLDMNWAAERDLHNIVSRQSGHQLPYDDDLGGMEEEVEETRKRSAHHDLTSIFNRPVGFQPNCGFEMFSGIFSITAP